MLDHNQPMSVRKIRNKWWVDLRFEDARHRRKSPDNTRAGALAYEATIRARLARGESPDAKFTAVTLAEFAWKWIEEYAMANNKASEVRTKRSILRVHLLPAFGRMHLGAITAEDIERYKATKLGTGLSRQSVNNHLNVLRKCLRTAAEWGYLKALPIVRKLKTTSIRIAYLTDDEQARLVSTRGPARDVALLALHTGMRFGELAGLRWEDVDLDQRLVTVRRSIVCGTVETPKSHGIRHVPLSAAAGAMLLRLRRPDGPVFRGRDGEPMTYASAVHQLRALCRRAGVRCVSWHVLRHTFASTLAMRGVPILSIQKLLGHSTVAMTERYAHLSPSSLRDAVMVLEVPRPCESWATGGQRSPAFAGGTPS